MASFLKLFDIVFQYFFSIDFLMIFDCIFDGFGFQIGSKKLRWSTSVGIKNRYFGAGAPFCRSLTRFGSL